ncbi:type I-E CRISPR-associated protein Cas5/CasD [Dietzia sp. SLG310A2-38A2]|uniref:type I-E CRISPR-associated protein Cas5/CasD n=1 Tax=Dietzia sp. SLG310A2-38A2 TaxID=1630643 RepID=UPI0015F9132E|nr:type I-E CRISPR-associated protein Cas5/CasD [Dietzia sp. SLG310A2-38A2]
MTSLLLRLAGPLQAWGDSSRFNDRTTRREPTKSGVVGMLAAASGRRRTDPIEDLASLRFGVRSDQQGRLVRDFQTSIDWRTGKSKPLTSRHYLSDACFVVAVEGEDELLEGLREALRRPVFPVYLGRRSCPPAGRVVLGMRDPGVEQALSDEPWQASDWYRKTCSSPAHLPVTLDATQGSVQDELISDHPVSFDPRDRRHGVRAVVHTAVIVDNPLGRPVVGHDPMSML